MPLFKCEKCGCVENTATSNYWTADLEGQPKLCSECDPEIGKWHGQFSKDSATGWKLGSDGFLYSEEETKDPQFKHRGVTIVGDA